MSEIKQKVVYIVKSDDPRYFGEWFHSLHEALDFASWANSRSFGYASIWKCLIPVEREDFFEISLGTKYLKKVGQCAV